MNPDRLFVAVTGAAVERLRFERGVAVGEPRGKVLVIAHAVGADRPIDDVECVQVPVAGERDESRCRGKVPKRRANHASSVAAWSRRVKFSG
jgi:hypothetical protein